MKNQNRLIAIFVYLAMTIVSHLSSASQQPFEYSGPKLKQEDSQKISAFFQEVAASLPPLMIERLNSKLPVKVRFTELKGHRQLLKMQNCDESTKEQTKVALGKSTNNSIELSRLFLNAFNSTQNQVKTCPQQLGRADAVRVLIHEFSHIYDSLGFVPRENQEQYRSCKEKEALLHGGGKLSLASALGQECQQLLERRSSVSDDPTFLKMAQFSSLYKNKNRAAGAMDHPYELTNSKEYFAVNMELFLLDESYPCHRPAHAQFLSEHFAWQKAINCKASRVVYMADNSLTPVKLDNSRIYSIHYLFAGKGQEMMSRWGHAMFRIVMCAPEHLDPLSKKMIPATPFGPACLNDSAWHSVVSFRANVDDIVINQIAGFFGRYDSLQFILPFNSVVDEYNKGEYRDVYSIPLRLTSNQKNQFLNKVLENYWDYRGAYKFLSNNCADESLDLLQSALPQSKISNANVLTPLGMLTVLGELTEGVSTLIKKTQGSQLSPDVYYPSELVQLTQRMKRFSSNTSLDLLKDLVKPASKEKRLHWFQKLISSYQAGQSLPELIRASHQNAAASAFLATLEAQSQIAQQNEMKTELQRKTEELEKAKPGTKAAAEKALKSLIDRSNANFIPNLMRQSYGVPQLNDSSRILYQKAAEEDRQIRVEFSRVERELFPEMVSLRRSLQEQERFFSEEARRWQTLRNQNIRSFVQSLLDKINFDCQKQTPECIKTVRTELSKIEASLGSPDLLTDRRLMEFINSATIK